MARLGDCAYYCASVVSLHSRKTIYPVRRNLKILTIYGHLCGISTRRSNTLKAARITWDCFSPVKSLSRFKSEETAESIAGHISHRMKKRYSHTRIEIKRAAVEALGRIGPKSTGGNFSAKPRRPVSS